jgi:hypothetical protein
LGLFRFSYLLTSSPVVGTLIARIPRFPEDAEHLEDYWPPGQDFLHLIHGKLTWNLVFNSHLTPEFARHLGYPFFDPVVSFVVF